MLKSINKKNKTNILNTLLKIDIKNFKLPQMKKNKNSSLFIK